MNSAATDFTAWSVDDLCADVEDLAESLCNSDRSASALLSELARRATEMDRRLSSKAEPEPSDPPPMPPPVDVWLYRSGSSDGWFASSCKPDDDWPLRIGALKIIPGMMTLDELAEHGLGITFAQDLAGWLVYRFVSGNASKRFDTALEAQWAATQLAKEGTS